MKKLRGGIIGTGTMGGIYAKLTAESGKVEIVAVFDTVFSRAESFAAKYNAKPLGELEAMLDYGVDIVYIAVPNNFHAPLTIACLDHGVHVFCEKPLATSLEDIAKIKEVVKRSGKRLFVGHNRRFAPIYLAAKQTVSESDYKPTSINIIQNDGDMGGSVWAADFISIGGFLYDTTVHFLDMAEYLMGEISEVRALGISACYEGIDDDFVIQIRFKDGGHGDITTNGHASWIFPFERVQVVGQYIVDNFEPCDIAIVCGVAGAPSHNERENGCREIVEAAGFNVVTVQPADSERGKAVTVAENILESAPDVKIIYATNDEMALDVYQAVEGKQKQDEIFTIGFDGSPDALKSIKEGKLDATLAQKPIDMGYRGVEVLRALLDGDTVEDRIFVPTEIVGSNNVEEFEANLNEQLTAAES